VLLEDSPVANLMLTFARKGVNWFGTPLELYRTIVQIAGKTPAARLPKTVHAYGNELRRIAPQLRLHGLSIDFERRGNARLVVLRSEPDTTSGSQANASSP
jgi:hypothetical protein